MLLSSRATAKARSHPNTRLERGATVVEAAIITPIFLLLIFGIIEIGLYLVDTNAVNNGARTAARQASASATDAYADWNTLQAANQALSNTSGTVEAVIVYRASQPTSPPLPQCFTALGNGDRGVPSECNIYRKSDFVGDKANFGWAVTNNINTLWDRNWAPTGRKDSVSDTEEPDFVGVWVRVRHPSLTGLIPPRKIENYAVVRIEPQRAT